MKPIILIALVLLGLPLKAENWPAWRGPTGQGISSEKNLPVEWSTNRNVKCRVALPEPGNSTPIVWNNRIFLTQASGNKRLLMCFNRDDGKLLWEAGPSWKEELTHDTNPQSSASAVTDGQRVIAFSVRPGCFAMTSTEKNFGIGTSASSGTFGDTVRPR